MKAYVLGLLLFASIGLHAQVKPIYYYGNKVTSDSTKATSYGIYGKVPGQELWILKKYNLYDELLSTGTFKDEILTIKHGVFSFYSDVDDFNYQHNTTFNLKDRYRFLAQQGRYENGLEVGKWYLYYPNGALMTLATYDNGVKNGEYASYDKSGYVVQKGNYVKGEKDGEWWYDRGRRKQVFKNGELVQAEKN